MMMISASAANRYYPRFRPSTAPSYGVSFNLGSTSSGRWQWRLGQSAQYAPLSAASFLASGGGGLAGGGPLDPSSLAAATNLQISTIRQIDLNTSGQVSYSVRRRTHLTLSSGIGTQEQLDTPLPSSVRFDTRLRVSQDLTRNLRGYVGYSLNQVHVPGRDGASSYTARIDGYDFGVDFSRPFQITRDTSVGIRSGFVKVPNGARNEFQIVGAATLDHRVGRNWDAQLVATRDARFVQAYRNPVVFAGLSASIGGQLGGARRRRPQRQLLLGPGQRDAQPPQVQLGFGLGADALRPPAPRPASSSSTACSARSSTSIRRSSVTRAARSGGTACASACPWASARSTDGRKFRRRWLCCPENATHSTTSRASPGAGSGWSWPRPS